MKTTTAQCEAFIAHDHGGELVVNSSEVAQMARDLLEARDVIARMTVTLGQYANGAHGLGVRHPAKGVLAEVAEALGLS